MMLDEGNDKIAKDRMEKCEKAEGDDEEQGVKIVGFCNDTHDYVRFLYVYLLRVT